MWRRHYTKPLLIVDDLVELDQLLLKVTIRPYVARVTHRAKSVCGVHALVAYEIGGDSRRRPADASKAVHEYFVVCKLGLSLKSSKTTHLTVGVCKCVVDPLGALDPVLLHVLARNIRHGDALRSR